MRKSSFTYTLLLCGLVYSASSPGTEQVTKDCMDCHGKDGVSTESDIPVIAGYSAQYIIDSMIAYKSDERPATESKYRGGDTKRAPTDMGKIAKKLTDGEIESIAEFFAEKEFVPRKQPFDATKAALGAKIHDRGCKKCHEDGGSSPDDDAGILAGQWVPYLEHAFKEYTSGKRPQPEKMKPKTEKLSPSDIEALIHYYASLQ